MVGHRALYAKVETKPACCKTLKWSYHGSKQVSIPFRGNFAAHGYTLNAEPSQRWRVLGLCCRFSPVTSQLYHTAHLCHIPSGRASIALDSVTRILRAGAERNPYRARQSPGD